MNKFLALLTLLTFQNSTNAQYQKRCNTYDAIERFDKKYPGFSKSVDKAYNNALMDQLGAAKNEDFLKFDTIFRIPVVFHIVWNKVAENIPDSVILRQMDILNRDFARLNDDTINTRNVFKKRAANAGIRFYLADKNPNGDSTNGIVRTQTSVPGFVINLPGGYYNDSMKFNAYGGDDAWPTERYLNVWVCKIRTIQNNVIVDDAILGQAFPPVDLSNWDPAYQNSAPSDAVDGVILSYKIVGDNNKTNNITGVKKGRTLVHEVGHYLGLRHVWGDGKGIDTCNEFSYDSDGIDDTPNSAFVQQQTCDTLRLACKPKAGNPQEPDMVENYMNYSDEKCLNMFTRGQVNLMRAVLKKQRKSLPTVIRNFGVDIEQVNSNSFVKVYPNPVLDNIHIEVQSDQSPIDQIEIIDELGTVVYSKSVHAFVISESIALPNLNKGFYFLRAVNEQKEWLQQKFVKL